MNIECMKIFHIINFPCYKTIVPSSETYKQIILIRFLCFNIYIFFELILKHMNGMECGRKFQFGMI